MNPAKRKEKLEEARRAAQAGDTAAAERIAQALLRANRADVQALHLLGLLAAQRHDDSAATGYLARCVALDPRNARFHNELARLHALAGRYGPALQGLEQAVKLQPGDLRALTDFADVLERSGQPERAWPLLAPHLAAGALSADMGLVAMRLLDRRGDTAQAVALGQRLRAEPGIDAATRRFLLQLLGRLFEKTGDVRSAFEAFAEAQRSETHRFDPAAHGRSVDALINAFSPAALARLPRAATGSVLPVFIACMPRSGSTLVEQVLHAHPQAAGAGETPLLHNAAAGLAARLGGGLPYPQCVAALDAATLQQMAGEYLQALAALAPKAERIVNKHLLNYVHLGLVALMFPGARVIHVRREPLDNGLACFMTSLSPALMPWATELPHIGAAWRHYERLMAHWQAHLGLQWLELHYEDLVNEPEVQIRRIVEFCGLPWDERCLRYWEAERVVLTPSYDQVRQPIFRSALGRWKKYEEFLGPLKQALAGA
jgi:tetratricopeptide (TPR) repeat protein